MTKCSGKYLGSPLYRGSILWDKIDKHVQEQPTVSHFAKLIVKDYQVYKDPLNWMLCSNTVVQIDTLYYCKYVPKTKIIL